MLGEPQISSQQANMFDMPSLLIKSFFMVYLLNSLTSISQGTFYHVRNKKYVYIKCFILKTPTVTTISNYVILLIINLIML